MANSSDSTSSSTQIPSPNSKPIMKSRRSRSSKKTPATLLNANTTNFRALVQQFTGCPRTARRNSSASLLIGSQKGPVTLNFKLGSVSLPKQHSFNREAPSAAADSGDFSGYDHHDHMSQSHYHDDGHQQQKHNEYDDDVEMKSSENGLLDDLEKMMMMMGDHGVDLTDEIACDHLQPMFDQNFDHDYFWNYMHNNQYPSMS
ncbi:VQ motif-containing protein [Euphorbia peplus]|nr:VQ motif-containing protein [Euphorbia peplus]